MAEPHLDHPGEVHWFSGYGPRQVIALCSHDECRHHALTTVAWGPDMARYELVECDADCAGNCRAWIDGRGVVTSQWLAVARSGRTNAA